MISNKSVQEQHTAGPNAIGFDYQFYYFMYLALDMSFGDTIGFEVRDDVHIEKNNGEVILFQGKHSVQTNASGQVQNLTALDVDLWKTLNNWVLMIKAEPNSNIFLKSNSFSLFTNKNEHFNEFVSALNSFKLDDNIIQLSTKLKELQQRTNDETIKRYLKNVISLKTSVMKVFMLKLTIETGLDDIINRIKHKILKFSRVQAVVDDIYDKLSSAMQTAKYLEIKERGKFEISFDDFDNKFQRCFLIAYKERPLPRRNLPILPPENLEAQIFIKQLIDIGELLPGSKEVMDYTEQKLRVTNHFTYWIDENLLFPFESESCEDNAVFLWQTKFASKYRNIKKQLIAGKPVAELEVDIRSIGIEILDYLREQNLDLLESKLGVEYSNGLYYSLADKLRLGLHLDWENKYQKK